MSRTTIQENVMKWSALILIEWKWIEWKVISFPLWNSINIIYKIKIVLSKFYYVWVQKKLNKRGWPTRGGDIEEHQRILKSNIIKKYST